MTEKISSYIIAEKQESLLFMAVGVLAICVAVWLWMNGHRLKAMAFPLVGIALIQLVVGGTVYFRSDAQLASLTRQFETTPAEFRKTESGRMQVVMKNFTTYKWIEVALLAIGVLLILLFQRHDLAAGIGAGLVLQSAFMLCLDMFAERLQHGRVSAAPRLPPDHRRSRSVPSHGDRYAQIPDPRFIPRRAARRPRPARPDPTRRQGRRQAPAMKMRDCSQAPDPKACEERRSKMRDAFKKAEDSCKGKEGPDRRSCMRDQMCAQAKDPGKCRERAEKHGERHAKGAEHRKEMMKACEGKKDDELRKCVRDERAKRRDEKK